MTDANQITFSANQLVGRFFEPDEWLGWKMIPGREGWYSKPEFRNFLHINRYGFRGQEYSIDDSPDTTRILLLADSFGAAFEVEEQCSFVRIFEKGLNDRAAGKHKFQVINTGVGGYGTEQEYIFLKERGSAFKPDMVVVAFHFGDDLIENSVKLREMVAWRLVKLPRPFLTSDGHGGFQVHNYPPPVNRQKRSWQYYYDQMPSRFYLEAMGNSNPFIAHSGRFLRRGVEFAKNRVRNIRRRIALPTDLWIYNPQPDALIEQAWLHTERLFAGLKRLTGELGLPLYVFGVCTKEQVIPGHLSRRLKAFPAAAASYRPDVPNQRLKEIMTRLEIPFHDPTDDFCLNCHEDTSLFWKNDLHWNENGHQLAGKILTEFLPR